MVTPRRPPVITVAFVDDYCQHYQHLFAQVRNFEAFKFLHLGILSEIKRKSLPAIARAVGLEDSQQLHHFLRDSSWDVAAVRQIRLWMTQLFIGDREIVLCIDETGDKKKGKTTDYTARQYIGNLGKTANGIVSVNAYGVVEGITYPLMFKIFKPRSCLQAGDKYKTKPELAVEIIQELKALGWKIKLVLADSLYGESGDVIGVLTKLKLQFIVAIRSNHPVWLLPGERVRYNRWRAYEQKLDHHQSEQRFIREIIFGKRGAIRYYQITKSSLVINQGQPPDPDPKDTWFIMTNLPGKIQLIVAQLYSLRTWIEYGFKQAKNELGWADFRLTDYTSIERWWEIIFGTYLLVSLQANSFRSKASDSHPCREKEMDFFHSSVAHFSQHPWWESGTTWKSALNNLRLIIQPYIFYCLISPWFEVFKIPGFQRGFLKLISFMNDFRASPLPFAIAI
jgi:SRSO17 transposase